MLLKQHTDQQLKHLADAYAKRLLATSEVDHDYEAVAERFDRIQKELASRGFWP